jgi:dienelactone hydrolase
MKRKTATLVGAAAALVAGPALAALTPAEASPVPTAASYAELLQPIPNATERLRLADAQSAADAPARIIPAQYHHHHHHHHHHNRRWYRSHGYFWSGGAWVLRPRHHHHHHNHNHNHN